MEQLHPFTSAGQAIDLLDNGGKFYNVFTSADDDIISSSEVSKLAGVVFEKQKAVLFLQMSLINLSVREQLEVEGRFDETLTNSYQKFQATTLDAQQESQLEELSGNVISKGIVKRLPETGYVTGFIQIPVVDTFTLIPISETYTVYELKYVESDEGILIAHANTVDPLPEGNVTVGGVIKAFQLEEEDESKLRKFIEVNYFTRS